MQISEELLFHRLSEYYPVERMGKILQSAHLPIPCFYNMNDENREGAVYITQVRNLPKSTKNSSLFICVGNYPPSIWSSWSSEVLYIPQDRADIFQVFNTIQEIYQMIFDWDRDMQGLLESGGNVYEMTRYSMNLFRNRICVSDYDFAILSHCRAYTQEGKRTIRMVDEFERIPYDITMLFQSNYAETRSRKVPYFIETHEGEQVNKNYCVPLYINGEYMGTCSLTEDGQEITESDQLLFQEFSAYIAQAISLQSIKIDSSFVSMRTIFKELLNNISVSNQTLTEAMDTIRRKNPEEYDTLQWTCMTLWSANRDKSLPGQYICDSLESILPRSVVFMHDDLVVIFLMLPESSSFDIFPEKLLSYLNDMNFQMGVSYPFTDIYTARSHYQQAVCAMEYCKSHGTHISLFRDCVIEHMLKQGCSRFEPDELLSPGLRKLRDLPGSIDYWDTLRRYLNNECNASKTAEELYLHRSTLLPRLEKIRSYVDVDTPKERLYLRMCIHLYDLYH